MKILSIIVGLILLAASATLSYVSANNGAEMLAKKDAIVMQYVDASDEALDDEDITGAIKYAKLAIQADPKSKKGYICYTNAMEEKYQTDEEDSDSPEAESSEESFMGC